ncbi:hypothetical protein M407DRAFT_216552 [Tulasnella calospora MUT 4182]|uniref:F-box domain-containing protein n=1 Tax=Tulasnella calospora MUT 4182 TaxID=1051891 RepID=A0A0C3ME55_9AGAM|nr:hypothetical protein M407DRAFT_216552 [Tulasnella calospora MUT 4182]
MNVQERLESATTIGPTNKLDHVAFYQLCAEYLNQSSLALGNPPTQESITALKDKVLSVEPSNAKILTTIDQWNTTQPISQLPPELIPHIVALGFPIADYSGGSSERSPRHYMGALASLSIISRMWRNAIIGTPSLWGLLSSSLPSHINRISLQRSGNCNLMVELCPWTHGSVASRANEFLDMALPHWDRWSHASLWFPPLDRIMTHLSTVAPSLEVFYLWVYPDEIPDSPINLFGGYAPRLQNILATRLPMVWDSEVFRGLQRLKLDSFENELISAGHILALLAASPLLEWFNIEDSDVGLSLLGSPPAQIPIQLPNLKIIGLDNIGIEAIGNILPFIRAPNCEVFWVKGYRQTDNPFDATDFLNRSLGHFDALLRFTLDFHESSQLTLLQGRIEWVCKSPLTPDARRFKIRIPDIKMNSSIPWISHLFGQGVDPAHRLRVFSRLVEVDAESLTGLRGLALLPNVQTLRMEYAQQAAEHILGLLGGANEIAQSPAFPGLEVLMLERASTWPFPVLESMLMRRYGEPGRGVTEMRPIRIVLAPPFANPLSGGRETRLQFEHLVRVRTLRGVESVTLGSPFGLEGMPACIYDDASGEYCNPF